MQLKIGVNTSMLKKTFIVCMLGEPFSWINQFVEQVQFLEKDGWEWLIFTPSKLESKGNIRFIDMDCEGFNKLCEEKTGVRPNFFITEKGVPSVHITDYYVASGLIFEDYLEGSDYWGIANLDIVFGNLSKFLPDSELEKYDVWTDDPTSFNGIFSLFKNYEYINNFFYHIPGIREKLSQSPCPKCVGTGDKHTLYGTDEYDMTNALLSHPEDVRYGHPKYYPMHSHDRLEQHVPEPKLEIKEDGSLYELFKDINGPQWIHAHPFIGREIPYFHFLRTKKWPIK